jgi:hypothetical protein
LQVAVVDPKASRRFQSPPPHERRRLVINSEISLPFAIPSAISAPADNFFLPALSPPLHRAFGRSRILVSSPCPPCLCGEVFFPLAKNRLYTSEHVARKRRVESRGSSAESRIGLWAPCSPLCISHSDLVIPSASSVSSCSTNPVFPQPIL